MKKKYFEVSTFGANMRFTNSLYYTIHIRSQKSWPLMKTGKRFSQNLIYHASFRDMTDVSSFWLWLHLWWMVLYKDEWYRFRPLNQSSIIRHQSSVAGLEESEVGRGVDIYITYIFTYMYVRNVLAYAYILAVMYYTYFRFCSGHQGRQSHLSRSLA